MNADNITKEGNQKIAEQYCRQAAKLGADVALMPGLYILNIFFSNLIPL